jgi:two-component system, cell cycle sensor histidine kinase and response regulator CckA
MTAHIETDLQPPSMTTHEPRLETKEACDFTGQGTILLVEDEQSLRSLIARGLRSRGYSVIEISNGVEALEMLGQSNVDLVVSDVVMPEMDGPTLLKTARVRYPNLKIIFISGYAEDVFEKSLPENQPLLPKPFGLGQLITAIKEAISLS